MGKRSPYRITRLDLVDVAGVLNEVREQRVVLGIDVAKEKMVATVMDEGEALLRTAGWSHPAQTADLVEFVVALAAECRGVEVAMEPWIIRNARQSSTTT